MDDEKTEWQCRKCHLRVISSCPIARSTQPLTSDLVETVFHYNVTLLRKEDAFLIKMDVGGTKEWQEAIAFKIISLLADKDRFLQKICNHDFNHDFVPILTSTFLCCCVHFHVRACILCVTKQFPSAADHSFLYCKQHGCIQCSNAKMEGNDVCFECHCKPKRTNNTCVKCHLNDANLFEDLGLNCS